MEEGTSDEKRKNKILEHYIMASSSVTNIRKEMCIYIYSNSTVVNLKSIAVTVMFHYIHSFSLIVKSRLNPFLEPTSTKQCSFLLKETM